MYVPGRSLDDLLRRVFEKLLKSSNHIFPSRGPATEITGALLRVKDPRARLSRTETRGRVFSCLGELFWYLRKKNDLEFIEYYLSRYAESTDDGKTIHGGYGPRLFGMRGVDQVANVVTLLRNNPDSRRAVIQLFDAADLAEPRKDVPCTCTLQFMIRNRRLCLMTHMRSNDAFLGLPHDFFAFTMIQEIIARTVGVELGPYMHSVGSLHLYEGDRARAQNFLDEGWQSTVPMPRMPVGDPWASISKLIETEEAIRNNELVDLTTIGLNSYWLDLARLLQIFTLLKRHDLRAVAKVKKQMSSDVYEIYIRKKQTVGSAQSNKQIPLLED